MAKSVYSLILNDDVIELVDRVASANGLSRSNMIEKILADAVSYETPAIRANNLFDEIERLVGEGNLMRFLDQPSQYMASIMAALSYRYNPAIKYNVEIFPHSEDLGQLKVTLRTQNTTLINLVNDFYRLFALLEKRYYNPDAKYDYDGIKYTRVLNYPNEEVTTQQLAELITEYVKDFNELLNTFLSNQDDERLAITLTEKRFRELFNGKIII